MRQLTKGPGDRVNGPGLWPTFRERADTMKVRPRTKPLMSRTLVGTEPEYLDTLPPIVQEFWRCDYSIYATDTDLEARQLGIELSLEEAMVIGREKYEYDLAAGCAYPSKPGLPPILDRDHPPIVYYMRLGEFVKIGTTCVLRQRFDAIHPQGVMAVEWGYYELERQRHNQFIDAHSHGEWFHLRPELVDHIFTIREAFRGDRGEGSDEWIAARLPMSKRPLRA